MHNAYTLLEMRIAICITMTHTDTLIAAQDHLQTKKWHQISGASLPAKVSCAKNLSLWMPGL